MQIKENVPLAGYTTLEVGGPAGYLVEAKTRDEILEIRDWAKKEGIEWKMIAGGSNLLVSDEGYPGLIIVNRTAGSGMTLDDLVDQMNSRGLVGMECLAGIPGTVGGAVYGNAGAYGQTISDHLKGVTTLTGFWPREKCEFGYRESIFKKNKEIILEAEFDLPKGDREALVAKSDQIRELRKKKYPPEMKCPGSFFMNLWFDRLPEELKKQIPAEKVKGGKIAAGYLLEQVGARGRKLAGAAVADYHGNLIYNAGGAKAAEIWELARQLQEEVQKKFGVVLVPEVQLLGQF
ncbi:MAG: UDP-N-acetylenolpyruvoylglucosamine reductase [Candidatus Amesbacteria bacterium GW2011_GWB1_47_26]|uniref:UDP-N-acetylenolpyruvoylglucosamine reductase n=1 Tax=Candidatus Amesbacteria bacterium GW2011_GWC2_45_19 TaxID=1618366 RepID=A0A0G1Q2A2_9BACT|nr:MAG: UDP-N-acetylenolpyruvoylglucosamine reductase [Candidatus Amesbacteria bacterium GW2011_GWC2_45_19]KKU68370.1 MAG: UDP-N-acetylenolpyruvoylglucosamine reductase [Microgenomates group bacterium GW2011_GWC1_47_20]KKU74444.1 MAG: UDP-N-acetylenolpyruvoylglucosamine reductase [Candidatus Amesbacteria bacterium GW2011_GWB1_47_26]KKU78613.1 MAG: UDP-N-acetylenolpyruvoylglucosamine reductase [Candidatus Amesbacteria bacterium GW2011_GWA2_47_70]